MPTLPNIFPDSTDLIALEPEELAGVLIEVIPSASQPAGFLLDGLMKPMFPPQGGGYPPTKKGEIVLALAEALAWLKNQGLVIQNPTQPAAWHLLTRRGRALKTRADLEAYRKGHALPLGLLQQSLANKVYHLFLRGDHDTAVFQAFKEVEVAVRKAGNYPNSLLGRDLMQKAFNAETGPLRNAATTKAERESEMFLFSGAIGHAKNPASHRDVNLSRHEAARLIVFASHLLYIVEQRSTIEQQS
jgi:uncharacterized protein (TIGR02391 family)